MHAVSVGEVAAVEPIINAFREREPLAHVVLSTTTPTGREMAARLAKGRYGEHIYYPWDTPRIVKRALDTLRPKAFVVLETEVWPNMLFL